MKLYRSRSDSKLFGLCGGIARSTGVDATLIRLGLVIGSLLTGGTLFFIYIVASMVVPKEPFCYGSGSFAPAYGFAYPGAAAVPNMTPAPASQIDAMIKDLEQQALVREIQALRHKLSRFEGQNNLQQEGDR